jgi:hypothetical protein
MQLNEMTPQSACDEIQESVRSVYKAFIEGSINKQEAIAELSYLRDDLDLRSNMLEHSLEEAKLFIASKLFIRMVAHQISQHLTEW